MKYKSRDDLNNRIERIIKNTVKHYYTDWKNYDRPKLMHCYGSNDSDEKKLILIVRECGTYLLKEDEAKTEGKPANTLFYYYQNQEKANFYFLDLENLKITKINEKGYEVR